MKIWKKWLLVLLVLSCCIGCDQVTKGMAKQSLQGSAPRSWFHNTIRLHYTENMGAFLGFGATFPERVRFWLLLVLPGFALCGILIFGVLSSQLDIRQLCALSCILGGGFSNLLDRALQNGRVADFLNIGIGSLRTGIFNVADVLIMFGFLGLLLVSVLPQTHKT